MLSFRLCPQRSCLFVLMTINAVGCHTMNGYTANSSGMGYYEQGNFTAAANEFQQAMLANPANPDYIANYAKAKMKLGDAQGAEQLYRQALTMSPSHQPSYHGMAESLISQGRSEDAASLLTTWAGTQPYIAESHVELAWLQREMGQPDVAAQSLQRALQVNPGHPTALAHLGQYYEEGGHSDQAVAIYQRSLQSDWNQPEVHSRLAAASQSAGPASPMAATAMARGVHPYRVPRQQTAFGPPSRGAQMARMQMEQTQMAMAGYPASAYGNQMAAAPGQHMTQMPASPNMNQNMMSAYYAPSNMPSSEFMPPNGGWQSADSIMTVPPDQTGSMSFGTAASETGTPEMQSPGQEWSFESTAPTTVPSAMPVNKGPNTALAPTPDPSFSAAPSSSNIANVSWSAATTQTPISGTPSSELPLVEAF
jgi:tetratricopeptide (TPR) repeat protein